MLYWDNISGNKMKIMKFIFAALVLAGTTYSQISDISRLPTQNPEQSYEESSLVVISENEILIFLYNKSEPVPTKKIVLVK
jgi:hypothetical protein